MGLMSQAIILLCRCFGLLCLSPVIIIQDVAEDIMLPYKVYFRNSVMFVAT